MKSTTSSRALFLAVAGVLAVGCSDAATQAADDGEMAGSSGTAGDTTSTGSGGSNGSSGSGSSAGGAEVTTTGSGGTGGMTSMPDAAVTPVVDSGKGAGDGASNGGWVPIWNGKDLTNWYPLIKG